ncbi:MAG: DUF2490 domain-containing protein [Gammaproteobacteria bacterium]|nr:DUF2490 domain-containing protein [Gammaproteobacteria bacterium]
MNPGHDHTRLLPAVLLVVCCAFPRSGAATENLPGAWLIFSTTDAFRSGEEDSRWHYHFDAQARYFDLGSGINQWLARPAIGYELGGSAKGWIGYARFRSRNRSGNISTENRYWQQVDWTAANWDGGRISMRVRVEQRSVSTGDDIGLVARLMAKYVRPLGNNGSTDLVLSAEPFFDLRDTDWGGDSGLAQNRLYLGIGRRLNNRTTIEAGYMNQYIWSDSGEDRINHLAMINFKVKL